MYKSITFFLAIFTFSACKSTTEQPKKAPILHAVADAYGFQQFDNIEKLSYTFNVQMGEVQMARSWQWWPKENRATLKEAAGEFALNINEIKTGQDSSVHKKFINDKYWLLFPFHLVWDDGFTHEIKEGVKSPINGEDCTQLSIQYNQKDGYTPADRYTLYLDKNHQIKEWEFTKGGDTIPSLVTDWKTPQDYKDVKVSLDHKNAAGTFRLWFSEVAIN